MADVKKNVAEKVKGVKKEKAPKTEKDVSREIKEHPKAEEKKSAKTEVPKATTDAQIAAWSVIKSPYLTEKSTRMIESQNKLVFLVKERATKSEIKTAVEAAFSVKVADVNTTSTMKGEKKAYVRLKPEFKAIDVATKLGMM